ncbi:hypothetical protein E1091_01600 [Micromonospora fluostatini]|uniref:Uncharacterized protein n=1 Tax=Micromonospora fluostatini TaxID=1629071 RepID=A0ABY2DMB5_9ACTN|nr:hypothetical protein E1091_01600 [Micromonospora fluostatini]
MVSGCRDCEASPDAQEPHECGGLCEITGKLRRASDEFHQRDHRPFRHECGTVLDDRQGGRFEVRGVCGWGCCVQLFCPGCRRYTGGWGPVKCPCQKNNGHGTRAEHKRPGAGRLVKASTRRARR